MQKPAAFLCANSEESDLRRKLGKQFIYKTLKKNMMFRNKIEETKDLYIENYEILLKIKEDGKIYHVKIGS